MQLGMIGLGRMGANMVRRLLRAGHAVRGLRRLAQGRWRRWSQEGAAGAASLDGLREEARQAARRLADGPRGRRGHDHRTNSRPSSRRATSSSTAATPTTSTTSAAPRSSKAKGIHYVDVGTSGGVWGLERGYCLMIGGEPAVVARLDPIFATLAPGIEAAPAHARAARSSAAPPSRATCTAGPAARATSSRWSTTASSTASWPPTPRG